MLVCRSNTSSQVAFGSLVLCFLTILFFASAKGQESDPPPNDGTSPVLYETDNYSAWKFLCTEPNQADGKCHLYQQITDDKDVPVTTVRVFPVRDIEGIAALATFHTPLETYLKADLKLGAGEEEPDQYPFSWCDKLGCYAQVQLSDDMIYTMKNSDRLTISIESVKAPGYPIVLELSLTDFGRAFSAIRALDNKF